MKTMALSALKSKGNCCAHEPVQTLLPLPVIITPADTASRLFIYDDSHSRFVFEIEHPHHFTTVASGLLGWCSSGETLDARTKIETITFLRNSNP